MNRAASKPPINSRPTCTPWPRIHSPNGPSQKPCHRSDTENANKVLVVISSIAPSDPCLQESVDVSVQYRGGVADLVVGAQILHHLVRMQHVGAHLVAPRAAAVTLQRVELCTFF